jgi:diguanylate cyclase (GGDEF)-like protein
MMRTRYGRRLTALALAIVLLALMASSVAGAAVTREAAKSSDASAALANAYHAADSAVAAEESLERMYRLDPTAATRTEHAQAGSDLQRALASIAARGNGEDNRLAAALLAYHLVYVTAVARMFDAVDIGDEAAVRQIDNVQTDPAFARISDLVSAASARHARAAEHALHRLQTIEEWVFVTTVAGFAVGLVLVIGCIVFMVGYQRTFLRQAAESRHRDTHDSLTGLPNRSVLNERLAEQLNRGAAAGTAVVVLDLDRFKEVNATLGHAYADELLRQLAARTLGVVRATDLLVHLGGDEFAVLLPDTAEEDGIALADRLIAEVNRSFIIDGVAVDVEASVGLAVAPHHGSSADVLLRNAETAMYAAKAIKTGTMLYRDEMNTDGAAHLLLLGDLRRALDAGNQLSMHYQPKIDLRTGQMCGVEALVRWKHPERGMISPADFIPVAENTGLINRLTREVIRMAIGQAFTWLNDGAPVPVAVNLSPRCLLDPTLIRQVTDLLRVVGLPTELLRLEITETAVMVNPAVALGTLHELHAAGIRLSIDDFGTGYSSMAYLKQLPVDELKIDRTFVGTMDSDRDDAMLVRAAVDLGHNLGLTVTAEGVETSAQVAALIELGCDVAQGYYFARPMPADDLPAWIHARTVSGAGIFTAPV